MKRLVSILIFAAAAFAIVQAQTPSTFDFYSDTVNAGIGSTKVITLCAVQTGSGANLYQPIAVGTVIVFRFGTGFGTVNSFSNQHITSWFRSTPSSNPVTISDFTVTTNPAAGKIIFTYNALSAKDMAFRDQICVDVNWTAPSWATEAILDLNDNVLDQAHPQTHEMAMFVR